MARHLSLALALAALCTSAPALATPAWVTGAPVNVRSGPGTENTPVGFARAGEAVEVLERNGAWAHVRTAGAVEGWVSTEYLLTSAPPSARVEEANQRAAAAATELERAKAEIARLEQATKAQAAQGVELDRVKAELAAERQARALHPWLVGAGILSAGALVGALLRGAMTTNRRSGRLRL